MSLRPRTKVICGYFMLGVPVSDQLIENLRKTLIDQSRQTDLKLVLVHYRGGDYSGTHFPNLDNYFKKVLSHLGCEYYVVTNDKVLAYDVFCKDDNFSKEAINHFSGTFASSDQVVLFQMIFMISSILGQKSAPEDV